ncbi:JAB domain-containing protein [Sphingomonas sp. RB3P16]|uniref:JAB domain-containing protein n=1 Tax=Parasphingomonas frigoris TaxID=3096163 RepID=UPI002FCA5227
MAVHHSGLDAFSAVADDAVPATVRALFVSIATEAHEVAAFGYFDPQWRLLAMRHVEAGRADSVAVRVRDVIADALAFDCALIVMAHNHPCGDPTPSAADYALTRQLARTLDAVGVRLVEHLVLAPGRVESFRARGLL